MLIYFVTSSNSHPDAFSLECAANFPKCDVDRGEKYSPNQGFPITVTLKGTSSAWGVGVRLKKKKGEKYSLGRGRSRWSGNKNDFLKKLHILTYENMGIWVTVYLHLHYVHLGA